MSTTEATDLERRLSQFSTYETTPDEAFALFGEARAAGHSVFFSEKQDGHHVFLDYADVKAAHTDWETYNSGPQVLRPLAQRPQFPPIEYDPPDHTAWRKLFAEALNPDTPKLHEDAVREDVGALLDELSTRESFDLQPDFAEQIPLLALCHVIGFDPDKRADVRRYTVELHASAGDPEKGAAAFMAFAEFGAREVYARLEDPRDDFLTQLARAQLDGRPLSPPELGATMNSFLNAGHGTTVSGLTSLLWEVLRSPEIRQRLIDDPSLIDSAVEEMLRWVTPVMWFRRTPTRDTEIHGVPVKEGDKVVLWYASGSRDEELVPDPMRFDIARGKKDHQAFGGGGRHFCLGSPLARLELKLVFPELLRRLPDMELAGPVGRTRSNWVNGFTSLPVKFTPTPRSG